MRKAIDTMDLLTSLLGLAGAVASIGVPLALAAKSRARTLADALAGEDGSSGESAPSMAQPPPPPYVPPEPMPPPAPRPPPPQPSAAKEALNKGGKFIGLVLLATPLAPLTPFIAPLAALLGYFADEHAKGAVAQPRLRQAFESALDDAEYKGYMSEWTAGQAAWEAGLEDQAREHFDRADAAGKAERLKMAQYIDDLNRDSYHAWMAKPHLLTSDSDWAMQGYTYGDGGYTLFPFGPIDADRSIVTGVRYQDGKSYRYDWRPGRPDYNGTEIAIVPLTPEQEAQREAARVEVEQRDAEVEMNGIDDVQDTKYQGGSNRRPRTLTPKPPASPAPEPQQPQEPAPQPPPPTPQAPVVLPGLLGNVITSAPPAPPSTTFGINLPGLPVKPAPPPAPPAAPPAPPPEPPAPPAPPAAPPPKVYVPPPPVVVLKPGTKRKLELAGQDEFEDGGSADD